MYEYFVTRNRICGDNVEKLKYAYKNAKEKYKNEEGFKEDRIKIFCLLREEKKIKQMFCILDIYETADTEILLKEIYKSEFEKSHMDWAQLFRIMGRVSEDTRNNLAEHFFGELKQGRSSGSLAKKIAQILHYDFTDYKNHYFTIVKSIYSVIEEEEFLNVLEHRLKVLENKSKMKPFDKKRQADEIVNYYHFLCEKKAYEAANSLLDRIWKEDTGETLLDKDIEEVKKMVYCWPNPSLLGFGKGYIQKFNQQYLCETWIGDIKATEKKAGSDKQWESIYKWLDVCNKVERLYIDRNDENLKILSTTDMYDVNEYSYMTQICCQTTEIIQDWILELPENDIVEKIKCLGDKNVFAYKLYDWYTTQYREYDKLVKKLKWDELVKKFEAMKDVNNLIYVFFNSPVWLKMDFFDFVKLVNSRKKREQEIEVLFNEYIIKCMIVDEDKKTSTGSQRFSIIPRYLFWTANLKSALRISPEWLEKNPTKISLQKEEGRDSYTQKSYNFKLCDFDNEIIYVVDAGDDYETEADKDIFLRNLRYWFSNICEQKKFIKWKELTDTEPMKVKEQPFTKEERVMVAEEFLDVIIELSKENEEEIWELLRCCSFRPLENINEFRYIAEQHWTDFVVNCEKEKALYQKVKSIFEKDNLPADLKLEIYMNTCAKKVYPLEELLYIEGIGELLFKENTEWVVPVKFEGHNKEEKVTVFSMESVKRMVRKHSNTILVEDEKKQNLIKTNCSFYLDGMLEIPEEKLLKKKVNAGKPDEREVTLKPKGRFVMYATLDKMDEKNRIKLRKYFYDSEEVKQYFPWREYKKCLYDLKEIKLIEKFPKEDREKIQNHNNALYRKVFKQLAKIDADTLFNEQGRVTALVMYQQLVGEMDEVFQNINLDIDTFFHILCLLGKKNPFWSIKNNNYLSDKRIEMEEIALERCQNTFHKFFEKIDGNSLFYVMTIFYLSPMRFVYLDDEEKYLKLIAEKLDIDEKDFDSEIENWETKFLEEIKSVQKFYERISENKKQDSE